MTLNLISYFLFTAAVIDGAIKGLDGEYRGKNLRTPAVLTLFCGLIVVVYLLSGDLSHLTGFVAFHEVCLFCVFALSWGLSRLVLRLFKEDYHD